MQTQGEFDDSEVWPEMPTGTRHLLNEECPDLLGEVVEFVLAQWPHVCWGGDVLDVHH